MFVIGFHPMHNGSRPLTTGKSSNPYLFESPKTVLQQRQQSWILGLDEQTWLERIHQRQRELEAVIDREGYPRVLLVQSDPLEFLAGFMAACICDCPVFLGNPSWQHTEWQQVLNVVKPHIIWDKSLLPRINIPALGTTNLDEKGWIMVPTGGSSGKIQFVIHSWSTLAAAVDGCQRHFFGNALGAINSCCWLPLYHVSGLMQFMRSLLTHGQLILLPKHCLTATVSLSPQVAAFLEPHSEQPQQYFLSLVPTQLQRLLQQGHSRLGWLARFRTILLGGGPAWPSLLQVARQHSLPIALTYGMTETAGQVATLAPEQFLQGKDHNGQVLPHVQLTIEDAQAHALSTHRAGNIVIQSAALCKGYYPQRFPSFDKFSTDDLGFFNHHRDLHIVGRLSRKIISGGENVYPEEIEAALLSTKMVKDAAVWGQSHPDWGQMVTAVVVPVSANFSLNELKSILQKQLSPYKQPKQWHVLSTLPRNPQGKVDLFLVRQAL